MANSTPRVRNYKGAAPTLQELEATFMLSAKGIYPRSIPSLEDVNEALDEWYANHYGADLRTLPGPKPRARTIIKLVTSHVEKLTHDLGSTVFHVEDISREERQENVRRYQQKVRGWISVVAGLSPSTRNPEIDRWVGKDVQEFFLTNKGAFVRIYSRHDLMVDFVARTLGPVLSPNGQSDGSLLTPFVGSLLAVAMAKEFSIFEAERTQWDEEPFPCVTLRDVDQSILNQCGMGEMFAAECRQIRRGRQGIEGFGTAQWYIDNGLSRIVASACDRSSTFNRGIDESNTKVAISYPRSESDDEMPELGDCDGQLETVQAVALLRKATAAHAFSNAVFFTFGNAESRKERCCITGMIAVLQVVDDVVEDKGLFGRLCDMERDFSSRHNAFERLMSRRTIEKEWQIGERAAGSPVTKDGESITRVIDALFEHFPETANRQKAIELLCDFYDPCRFAIDLDRHAEITHLAIRELARGLTPPTAHPSFGHSEPSQTNFRST